MKYADSKVVLFGHSFGGSLSYRYLIDHQNENAVDGLISICGPYSHDGDNVAPMRWKFRRDYLLNVSDLFLTRHPDDPFWLEVKAWALATDPIDTVEKQRQWN